MKSREQTIRACYQIPGQMWLVELGWLYDTLCASKRHVEIGAYCGRSLVASCGGMTDAEVFAVDNDCFDEVVAGVSTDWVASVRKITLQQFTPDSVAVTHLAENSIDAARHFFSTGKLLDSLFIDGCHEYAECRADIEAWATMVKPGGLICGHDYWPVDVGVMEAVNDAFEGRHEIATGTRIWWTRSTLKAPS